MRPDDPSDRVHSELVVVQRLGQSREPSQVVGVQVRLVRDPEGSGAEEPHLGGFELGGVVLDEIARWLEPPSEVDRAPHHDAVEQCEVRCAIGTSREASAPWA